MNKGNRIAAVALSCALVVGAAGEAKLVPVAAAEGATAIVGRFARFIWTFEPTTGTLIIDGDGEINMQSTNLPWSSFASQIKRVIFRNGVRSIPTGFFDGMVQLQEVIIPATVTEIGENLFADHKNVSIYYEGDADLFKQMLNATNQGDIGDNVSSVRVTVEISADGSKTETIERADGTKTIIEYNPDGTLKSHTDINANGEGRTQRADDVDGRTWIFSRDPEYGYEGFEYYEMIGGVEYLRQDKTYNGTKSKGTESTTYFNVVNNVRFPFFQEFLFPAGMSDEKLNNPDGVFSSVYMWYTKEGVLRERKETRYSTTGLTDWKTRVVKYAADGVTTVSDERSNTEGRLTYQLFNYQEGKADEKNNPDGEYSSVEILYNDGVQAQRKETKHDNPEAEATDWKTRTVTYAENGEDEIVEEYRNADEYLTYLIKSYPEGSQIRFEEIEYYGDAAETERHRYQFNSDESEMYEDRNADGSLSYQYFIYPENVKDEVNNPDGEFCNVEIEYENGVQIERTQTRHSSAGATDWETRIIGYAADGETEISDVRRNADGYLTYIGLVHMYVCTQGNEVSLFTKMKNHKTEKENAWQERKKQSIAHLIHSMPSKQSHDAFGLISSLTLRVKKGRRSMRHGLHCMKESVKWHRRPVLRKIWRHKALAAGTEKPCRKFFH